MHNLVTLVLILHNRHHNLDRLLHYYHNASLPILIADSSTEKYNLPQLNITCRHLYTPGITFTKKIELVLKEVKTPYVVMCADDDFIVPEAIVECVSFLEADKSYSVAQGSCIKYYRNSITPNRVDFGLLYKIKSYDIISEAPLVRLEQMFEDYRSVLYAVHRTEILKLAFNNASSAITNLYLNEYLTAVIPILSGKYKELPVLYQVREFAEDSDDKTTDNLDIIFSSEKYKPERQSFINLLVENAKTILHIDEKILYEKIKQILEKFAASPQVAKKVHTVSVKKRAGMVIKKIPVLGHWIVDKNRRRERENELKKLIQTNKDQQHLQQVENILKHFSNHL